MRIDLIFRHWPRTHWVRLGLSITGTCDPAPRGQWLYCKMVRRYAWTIRKNGIVLMWMPKKARACSTTP